MREFDPPRTDKWGHCVRCARGFTYDSFGVIIKELPEGWCCETCVDPSEDPEHLANMAAWDRQIAAEKDAEADRVRQYRSRRAR